MAMVVTVIAAIAGDFDLSTAKVQRREINHKPVTSLF
jgi:hypothetical protein